MEKVQPVSRMISTTSAPGVRERRVVTKSGSKSERVMCAFSARGRGDMPEVRRSGKWKDAVEGEGDDTGVMCSRGVMDGSWTGGV